MLQNKCDNNIVKIKSNQSYILLLVVALLFVSVSNRSRAEAAIIPPNSSDVPQSLFITVEDALKGNVGAQLILADVYYSGHLVPKNVDKAVAWYELAAANDNIEAQNKLSTIYSIEEGYNNTDNFSKAINWFKKLAEKGDTDAQIRLSDFYIENSKDYVNAIFWLKKASKTDVRAIYKLARIYNNDKSSTYNPKLAFYWFEKAAIGGKGDAMYYIGHEYNKGETVNKDYFAAYKWIKRSLTNGNSSTKQRVVKKRKRELKDIKSRLTPDQIAFTE